MILADIKTWKDLMAYIVQETQGEDTALVMMALAVASILTWLMFYTDTPEALASAIGDLPGQVLSADTGGLVAGAGALAGASSILPGGIPGPIT